MDGAEDRVVLAGEFVRELHLAGGGVGRAARLEGGEGLLGEAAGGGARSLDSPLWALARPKGALASSTVSLSLVAV